MVFENVKRETDSKKCDEGEVDHGHSQQIKLNNFNVSLLRRENIDSLSCLSNLNSDWGFLEMTRRMYSSENAFGALEN